MASPENLHQLLVSYRSGDMWAPRVQEIEALKAELAYFHECLASNTTPFNDGIAGLRIVKMLEAAERSVKNRGKTINLHPSGVNRNWKRPLEAIA
jgi:hypothetical protein